MPGYNLLNMLSNSYLSINTLNERSRVLDIEVPQGIFLAFNPNKPTIIRPGAVEFQTYTVPATVPTEFDLTALSDNPVEPPNNFVPTWPSTDGYTFKVFMRLHDTSPFGAWTRATINAVDWSTKVLTIALPGTLPDNTGASHTIASGDVLDIRISYAFSSGSLEISRETPDNAVQRLARTFYTANPAGLNGIDQYGYAKISFPSMIWAPEFCHIRGYLNAPVYLDIGQTDSVTDTTYTSSMTVTKLQIPYEQKPLGEVQTQFSLATHRPGYQVQYSTLYSLFVAQLAGIAPEVPLSS